MSPIAEPSVSKVVIFNKPYGVMPQFTDSAGRPNLADYLSLPGIYPAGRLDRDSEGLMALTDDGMLQHRISDPRHKLPKTYWVQVEGIPDEAALEALRRGVPLNDGMTAAARAQLMAEPDIWLRDPPISYRAAVPTAWIELVLREGRNRQVRRMTAAVGHPTLRLIRWAIGNWNLADLAPGHWRELDPEEYRALLSRPVATSHRKGSKHERLETPRHRRGRTATGGKVPPGGGRGRRTRGL